MNLLIRGMMLSLAVLGLAALPACSTTPIDPTQAQATSTPPVQNQVPIVSLPYEPGLPTFVVAVEPFDYSASGQISGGGQGAPISGGYTSAGQAQTTVANGVYTTTWSASGDPDIGPGMAAQLITALSRWGNVSVIDWGAITKKTDGTFSCKLQPGEIGPFVVRGTVTEFAETADANVRNRGGSLGPAGAIVGITGALTGNRDVAIAGGAVAAANPNWQNEEMKRTGYVGMDIRLLDGGSGRIVGGYTASGTFTTISKVSGGSVFGIGGSNTQFAASALGNATRAAMNDAVVQTANALKVAAARRR